MLQRLPQWVVGVVAAALVWILWSYRQRTAPPPQPPFEVGPPAGMQRETPATPWRDSQPKGLGAGGHRFRQRPKV